MLIHTLNKIIQITLAFGLYNSLNAQDHFLTKRDWDSMSLNGLISFSTILSNPNYEALLNSHFGSYQSKACSPNPITINGCDIAYSGLRLIFDWETELLSLKLTDSNYYVQFGTHQLKVGANANLLEALFSSAFSARKISSNSGHFLVNMPVGDPASTVYLSFEFNQTTNLITEITILNIIS